MAEQSAVPTVCVTVDFDGHAIWLQGDPTLSPTKISRADFSGEIGLPRLLDLFAAEELVSTVFVPGHTVETFPEVCRRFLDEGHELGHHGYLHKNPPGLSAAEERVEFERGLDAYDRLLSTRPIGYRAPGGDLSVNSIALAHEFGLGYDASASGSDYQPYYARTGDSWQSDGPFVRGHRIDLVEFGVLAAMIDVPQMEFLLQPVLPGLQAYEKILRMWCDEFDWMCEQEPDGLLTLVLHPTTAPKGARLRVVRDFLRYAKAAGARFITMSQAATEYRAAHPFAAQTAADDINSRY
jgi:peptidoglycan/xylan/chitin deacetylase (PgdA/CDA1 family)